MRQSHGLFDDFDIFRDLSRPGNTFYIDDGSTCGVVYFPNVRALRRIAGALNTVPNGRISGKCGNCGVYRGTGHVEACAEWIKNLVKGVSYMNMKVESFIDVKTPGDLFGEKSYIKKLSKDSEGAVKKEFLSLLHLSFFPGGPYQLKVNPENIKQDDVLAVRLIWGRASKPGYKNDKGKPGKISETFYVVETQPDENTKSLMDCLKKIPFKDVQAVLNR